MDFTSESTGHGSSSGAAVSRSSSSLDDGLLPEADLKVLRLHEQREQLLSQRNRLLQEIESLKSRQKTGVVEDARILDLVLLARWERSSTDGVTVIDGSTDLQEELATKCDTLPLLNMEIRLQRLRELYVDVELQARNLGDSSSMEIKATYRKRKPGFHVILHLQYQDSVLVDCQVVDISQSVKWELRNLVHCKNPTKILLGCYEFDSLCERRRAVFDQLRESMNRYASLVKVDTSREGAIELARSVPPAAVVRVQWLIDVADTWPSTTIVAALTDGAGNRIDIEQIKIGLFKEYGVNLGLQELCKACLSL